MEQKSYLTQLFEKLKQSMPEWIKKYAPLIAMKVFGKAGGLYTWVISLGMKEIWKIGWPKIRRILFIWDENKINKENVDHYENTEGTKDEKDNELTDVLNGNKP